MGDRVSASTHTGSTSTYTTYLVDPSGSIPQILAEYPNSGLPTYYVPAGTLIGQDSGTAGGLSYFATDGLGSVRGTYNTSGANVGVSNFDPYGATLPDYAVTGTGSHIGYTGAMTDSNGLVYLNARYYDPANADFLSSDPLAGQAADPATFNLYAYVSGNPINRTDPSGKAQNGCPDDEDCGGGGGGDGDPSYVPPYTPPEPLARPTMQSAMLLSGRARLIEIAIVLGLASRACYAL